MANFSFDIESTYDKAEMNNAFMQAEKSLIGRYDFKGTPAAVEWMADKKGIKIIGSNAWQCETILDIVRSNLTKRGVSSKTLDTSAEPVEANLRATWEIPFISGLSQPNAKKITALLRDNLPKLKAQIQGDTVRVIGQKKDELQQAMRVIEGAEFDFATLFTNFR